MSVRVAIGESQALDSFEAATQASHQALQNLGRTSPAWGWVIASNNYAVDGLLRGFGIQLGDIPLVGFSTSGVFTQKGISPRSVVVCLVAIEETQVVGNWWPEFGRNEKETVQNLLQTLDLKDKAHARLFLVTDGINGDIATFCEALPQEGYPVIGCLACSDINSGQTFQLGGKSAGYRGMGAMLVTDYLKVGIGHGHGWQPSGAITRVSRARGLWIRSLEGHRAAETYARIFGYTARQWSLPPLNYLIRQYPLGIETAESDSSLIIRSPLRVEADGSLRMHTAIPHGQTAHIMIASRRNCLDAARRAAQEALQNLHPAQPVLGLIFADTAWQHIFTAHPGAEIQAIQSVLGPDVPIIGGYTYGQILRPQPERRVAFLNQEILITLFGIE